MNIIFLKLIQTFINGLVYNVYMSVTKNSTTIRIQINTKSKLEKLDFVKKHSYDEIINELITKYNKKGKNE